MSENRPGFCHLCEKRVIAFNGLCAKCAKKIEKESKKEK